MESQIRVVLEYLTDENLSCGQLSQGGIENRAISGCEKGVWRIAAVLKGEKEASFLPGGNGTSRNPFSAAAYGAGRQVGRVIRPAFGTRQTVQNLPLWTVFADCIVNIDMNLLAALQRSPIKGHGGLQEQNDSSTLFSTEATLTKEDEGVSTYLSVYSQASSGGSE
jgi:hypothetical protein